MSVLPANTSQKNMLPPPRHVAIIMDGNGRWAQARQLPRRVGHHQGVTALRAVVRAAQELGIQYLTLYSFSSENWGRPAQEINDLMALLRQFVKRDLEELERNGVNIRVIGERKTLPADIAALVTEAEDKTRRNDKLNLLIAFNYGGQDEIVAAARAIAQDAVAGKLDPQIITKEVFARYLQTSGVPDPDLIIRTSGEQRLSNFLTFQSAYAELVFVDTFWPDFTMSDLRDAIAEYHRRERRFGVRNTDPAP